MENWCNLEGQYLHLVADMTEQIALGALSSDEIKICGLGVYGTKYARSSSSSVPSSVEVVAGESLTISIENISSFFTIGNELVINMRQSAGTSPLNFITFIEGSSATDVVIDATY